MRAKAKMFVPCARLGNSRCPGTMQLQYRDKDLVVYAREFYRCDNRECVYHETDVDRNRVYIDRINWEGYVRADDDNRGKRKTGDDAPTKQEMETMI